MSTYSKKRFRSNKGLPATGKKSLRYRGLRLQNIGVSLIDELAKHSEFGGTIFERAADGAAHAHGHHFDAAQFYVPIPINGNYTLIDRVVFNPLQAVYLDGIQHRLRSDSAARDLIQGIQLEYDGWRVVRITDIEFIQDPIGVIERRIDWFGTGAIAGMSSALYSPRARYQIPPPPEESLWHQEIDHSRKWAWVYGDDDQYYNR